MPITASYSAATRKLSAIGSAVEENIVFNRNVAGQIFVNGGAVPVSGGTPTVANTDLIEAFGLDLDDVISLDETNGILPAADLFGGNGNDQLTGGSNGDSLFGDAGGDALFGRGGIDELFGGLNNDVLTGGDANDTMSGEAGNDRMIWNPGDDNDVMEGGPDTDIAEVNGGNGAESFSIAANGTRVLFARVDPAPFSIDIGTTETLVLNANGGDDVIEAIGNLSALIALTIDGGAGNDTINAGNGSDTLIGGDGNDFIDGNQGPDFALLGLGNDVFKWDPGDGSDIIEGQADADQLLFNGSNASENIDISINPGGRVRFFRDVAAITMDLNDVESIRYNALAGADNIVLADMTGTDLVDLTIDLGASGGGGDGQADRITLFGNDLSDSIAVTAGSSILVAGLFTNVQIEDAEAIDRLVLAMGLGNDVVNATGIAAGQIIVELRGDLGADTLFGSEGGDFILGGDGNDSAFMGAGNDTFTWNPGDDNDVLEGQAGTDTMDFNGAAVAENISISPNGGRIIFFRDVASVGMDLNDVERIIFNAGAAVDSVVVGDLSGTDVTEIIVNLASTIGGTLGDAANDTVSVQGSSATETINVTSAAGALVVSGLPFAATINTVEAADALGIVTGLGNDTINASAVPAGIGILTLSGEGGDDNIVGGSGADLLFGGANNDLLAGGAGGDQMFGGLGNDRMIWNPGDGTDLVEGNDGSDVVEIRGGEGAETFTIQPNGSRVRFDRIDPAPFAIDIGTTETLLLLANGGNDLVSATGSLAALIGLTIDGGAGDDTILSANGADVLVGGDGNDFVDGNQGNDVAFLGAGADFFQWDVGDGNDTVEGQADIDTLRFNGSTGTEVFTLSANGARTRLQRDLGLVVMDVNDVENFIINALGGLDTININDLTVTDVTGVTLNLSGSIGGTVGDTFADTINAAATGNADVIDVTTTASGLFVTGLPVLLTVNQSEAGDALVILAGGGNDTVSAVTLASGIVGLTLDGGLGNDGLFGSAGGDTLFGGDGNDTVDGNQGFDVAFLGAGDDVFIWDPGDSSDVLEGQLGEDTLRFNGSNAGENISISANGARVAFVRDVAAVTMDIDDVETITFNALNGVDNIIINDLTGTDMFRVVVDLAGFGGTGGGDGQVDTVTVNARTGIDNIQIVTTAPGVVTITGLASVVEIRNFEGADRLIINTLGGDDVVDASALDVGLAFIVDTGDGNDTVTGGDGRDVFMLGLGLNTVFVSPGGDVVSSAGGTINIFG